MFIKEKEVSDILENGIKSFCGSTDENSSGKDSDERLWDDPIVGFAQGDDPLFHKLKKDIGPFYWAPLEIFTKAFPKVKASPEKLTVISWILPQTSATKADNRKETLYPSKRWAISRFFGESFNNRLRNHVVELLHDLGYEAVAPVTSTYWERKTSMRYGFASTWSERHAAYIAGLGTFGLCDGLITPLGKAMRCGSVIAHIDVEPSKRTYIDHHEYCLYFSKGTCKECVKRCPANAISEKGHDKVKCKKYIRQVAAGYIKTNFGLEVNGCGLCQTLVPCESQIPLNNEN
jgi:epoxyqueuosine reductase QueG